jgi:L-fucose mutarotase
MLKLIPPAISPDLMDILMRMGHGDELVLADGNFPAETNARQLVRADGHGMTAILDAILHVFPIDDFVETPVLVMKPVDATAPEPPIWNEFRTIISHHEKRIVPLHAVERFEFYDLTKNAFAIVSTSERAIYANLILKKGVVPIG